MTTSVMDMSELAELSRDELETELTTLAAHLHAGTCRWLELVGELDRRRGWIDDGRDSCAAWLARSKTCTSQPPAGRRSAVAAPILLAPP